MTRIIVPTILALLIGGSAWAFAPNGEYVSRFNYSCPQVVAMYQHSELQKDGTGVTFNRSFSVIIGWMAGYISHVNSVHRGKADFYGNLADEASWVAKWCRANRTSDLIDAMEALTAERTAKGKPAKAKAKPASPARPAPRTN